MLSVRKTWMMAILFLFVLSGCGLSLAEDITPPPNYREPTAAEQPVEIGITFPLVPPDPDQGAAIYAEKCQPCHGETGMGDGPQAANLSVPTAPLGSSTLARSAHPVDWYRTVTLGNIERFMPGFASLNDRERWDVIAYAFTLSTSADELAQGKASYEQNCATCHGLTGRGDGEQADSLSPPPSSWNDQERLSGLSANDMVAVMTGGAAEHPSFAAQLTESQQYAVAGYVRSLSFATEFQTAEIADQQQQSLEGEVPAEVQEGDPEQSEVQDELSAEVEEITIYGQVANATPGGTLPEGLKVVITAYEGMAPAFETIGDVAEDGTYRVANVDFDPEYVYFAQVEVNDLSFNSDILHGGDIAGAEANLPIKIYDITTDLAALRTDRLHIFFDFTQPGVIQVVSLFIISNTGGQVVVAPGQEHPVINFALPEGAMNLQFQDGEIGGRYILTENGFGDRLGIAPGAGQHQVLFAYTLPYNRKLSLAVPLPLPVEAAIVMVPPVGVELRSEQLMDAGQRDVQGMSFQIYQTSSALQAGDELSITLSGSATAEGAAASQPDSIIALLIGAGVFGVVLIGAGIWVYRQRAAYSDADETNENVEVEPHVESSELLLDAIVALDDLHASGELPEAAYQERRLELKACLADALAREDSIQPK